MVDFLCHVEGGRLRAASDVSQARWAHRDKLAPFHLAPATVRVIEKAVSLSRPP